MNRRRQPPRLMPKDPRELERDAAMQAALSQVRGVSAGKSVRGPGARPRQRSVFQ